MQTEDRTSLCTHQPGHSCRCYGRTSAAFFENDLVYTPSCNRPRGVYRVEMWCIRTKTGMFTGALLWGGGGGAGTVQWTENEARDPVTTEVVESITERQHWREG